MNKFKISHLVYGLILIPLGIFLFIYGGWDDSPGAQLLGLLVAIGGIYFIKKSRRSEPNA